MFEPLDDIEPRFAEPADDGARPALGFMTDYTRDDTAGGLAESAYVDYERVTDLSEAGQVDSNARPPVKFEL